MRAATIRGTCVVHVLFLLGLLAWSVGTPAVAANGGSSTVNFVDRAALTSDDLSASAGNPLRSGGGTSVRPLDGNTLRHGDPAVDEDAEAAAQPSDRGVVPASYNGNASRGLQLRPYKKPSGIFSAYTGDTNHNTTTPSAAAAKRNQGLVQQLMSSAHKKGATTASAMQSAPRAGSANQLAPTAMSPAHSQPSGRPVMATVNQSRFRTAESAQSYRHAGMPGSDAKATVRPAQQPAIQATRKPASFSRSPKSNDSQPVTSPGKSASPATSDAAQALIEAHKLSETASTEDDYSDVFAACERVPANEANEQETAFGRELASWALNRRGQLRASAGRTDEALSDFDTAIHLDPKCWRAIHNRGVLMAQARKFERAFDDFHRTIELNPKFAKAYSNRAALYVVAGQLDGAAQDYQQAIALDPSLAVAHRGYGRACHQLGRMNEAAEHLDKALELSPNDASALTSRGDLRSDLGQYADAAADYDQALEINPKSVDACRSSAWLLATCPDESIRDPEVALRRAQLAAELEKKDQAVTFDTLAAAQANAGDFRQAMRSIRQAIDLAPTSERSAYEDHLRLYRQSTPLRIEPIGAVQQANYKR